jgi:hypothetical protein
MKIPGRIAAPHFLVTCLAAAVFIVLPGIATARGALPQDPKKMETHDDLLLRVERGASGFGGMYVDKDGQLAVYLTDSSQLPAARAAIVAVFGPAAVPAAGIRAVAGQYTLSQLAAWRKRATRVMQLPGVVFVDLDEAKNRVAIGVDGVSRTEAVQKMLTSLEIPARAVRVEVTDPIDPVKSR